MKTKNITLLILALLLTIGNFHRANALELGLRSGQMNAGNYAIDATFPMWGGRIHADLAMDNSWFGNQFGVDALYDLKLTPFDKENWAWFIGAGVTSRFASAGIFNNNRIGVAGEIGAEYRLEKAPFVVGADWRPSVTLIGGDGFTAQRYGINFRYVF